ncbi:MAG: aminotransferase class I/II-fold pyridoxal phosphate-dependent enzyme, partial [Paracoccaceae bacterium]|nr:aminotransferase class I/II-fold pyridoxal phosphate-dependent enzyme [Paracoccaceae bacterium]
FEIIKLASPESSVWISNPSWPNHRAILDFINMNIREYSYFDRDARSTDFSGMMSDLKDVRPGDAIVLHGCCHNPTGSDLPHSQWEELAEFLLERKVIPIIDFAYQGFGDGLNEDAKNLRMIASKFPETLIAGSCSKNFGIYRERTGIMLAVAQEGKTKSVIQGVLSSLNRLSLSFPPDHGARLVTMILNDDELSVLWREELEATRRNLQDLRVRLAGELRDLTGSDRFGFLASHKGMFSLTGCTPEQVVTMREKHGIYLVGDSRINVAGLNEDSVPHMARAMVDSGM